MPEFYVSAPGKVIIFGEHSAVYGKPAIAAALNLRAYLLVKPSVNPDEVELEFPDIDLRYKWKVSDIPWDELSKYVTYENGVPETTEELVPEVLDLLNDLLVQCTPSLQYTACKCFLYLYANLCNSGVSGHYFCIRSTLPIGAGLGSSASTAVCLAAALSALGGHIMEPEHKADDMSTLQDLKDAEFIDAWSLMGETCFHGNPSGIDNAVATHGDAVLFQRMTAPGIPSVRTKIRNFSAVKLFLTNSKVPRSTAELVASVASQNRTLPKISNCILDAMGHLVNEAYQIMSTPFLNRSSLLSLVNINHGLLVALGVSHPCLESIRQIADTHKLGATKLTGAGGGGCTITFLRDDISEQELSAAIEELELRGYETYSTMLGGKGVGMLQAKDFPADAADKFSVETFSKLASRDDIESSIGASVHSQWRYW
ncbi:mevalonate kinase [Metschnikowia bicuspidata]|uniref:Mevalonate kinase n=1 Tax=Metschnikowia bicuspidata TaxID=27322 RepID=A0A4P9ZAM1_9ASCO|nr:mevalonate kinase [Metschnikowia bicuspidata]